MPKNGKIWGTVVLKLSVVCCELNALFPTLRSPAWVNTSVCIHTWYQVLLNLFNRCPMRTVLECVSEIVQYCSLLFDASPYRLSSRETCIRLPLLPPCLIMCIRTFCSLFFAAAFLFCLPLFLTRVVSYESPHFHVRLPFFVGTVVASTSAASTTDRVVETHQVLLQGARWITSDTLIGRACFVPLCPEI